MGLVSINRNVVSGQCYKAFLRLQIGYTAIFLNIPIPKGWQGLQLGFFAPRQGYMSWKKCIRFYAKLLPGLGGTVRSWPKWYYFIYKLFSFNM